MTAACRMKKVPEHRPVLTIPAEFPLQMKRVCNHGSRAVHRHDFSELVIVFQGRSTHLTDDGSYNICAGDVFVVLPGASHGYRTAPEECFSIVNIMFRFDRRKLPFFELRKSPGFRMLFELEPGLNILNGKLFSQNRHLSLDDKTLKVVLASAERLEAALNDTRAGHQFRAVWVFAELVALLSDYFSSFPLENAGHSHLLRLCQVLEFMEKHYTEPLYVPDLAKMASMSGSNFYRVFTALIGTSADRYLIRLRLSHAEALLAGTDLPMAEIAERSGFEDSNYFSRVFRRNRGCSPREYRKQRRMTATAD